MSFLVLIIVVGVLFTNVEPVFSTGNRTRESALKNKHLVVAALDVISTLNIYNPLIINYVFIKTFEVSRFCENNKK